MGRFNVTFAGNSLPAYTHVVDVKTSILPSITQNTIQIPARVGEIPVSNNVGVREIEIEVIIKMEQVNTLPVYVSGLAEYLYYDAPQTLIIEDNKLRTYYAMYTGVSDVEESVFIGRATLKFVCYDPYAYGQPYKQELPTSYNGEVIQVPNMGSAPVNPIIRLVINEDITNLAVVSGDSYVDIGNPLEEDTTAQNYEPWALSDPLSSFNGWSTSSGVLGASVDVPIENWVITENSEMRIKTWQDEQGGSQWKHGGAIQKQLKGNPKDFEFYVPLHFDGYMNKCRGEIQTNILDPNQDLFVNVEVTDFNIDAFETIFKVKLVKNNERQEVYRFSVPKAYWDFIGALYIKKQGKKWTFTLKYKTGKGGVAWTIGGGNSLKTINSKTWYDNSGKYENRTCGFVQLCQFMFGNYSEPNWKRNNMLFFNAYLKNLDTPLEPKKVPIIFYAGDEVVIDNEVGTIYRNGDVYLDYFSPDSTFIELTKKQNGIVITPSSAVRSGSIEFTPRYL